MKVLYIFNNLNRTAPNTVLINLLNEMKEVEVFILSMNRSSDDNYIKIIEELNIEYREYFSLKDAILDIKEIHRKFRTFDIIHLNGYHPNILGFLLQQLNKKYKMISTCHAIEAQEAESYNYKGLSYLKIKLKQFLQKKFYVRHDKSIAVSREVQTFLRGLGCQNTEIIYNGVNFTMFPEIQQKEYNENLVNLCQVGHVNTLKNQMLSVRLVNYLSHRGLNVKLHIFGSLEKHQGYVNELREEIMKLGLDNKVLFYGSLSFQYLFEKLKAMDILVMPSRSEGMPLALMEAFYFQIPAIVSLNGGMKEVVCNNENGLVIDIEDTNIFETVYQYIHNKEYINDGVRARKTALERFDSRIMAMKYCDEYRKLLI